MMYYLKTNKQDIAEYLPWQTNYTQRKEIDDNSRIKNELRSTCDTIQYNTIQKALIAPFPKGSECLQTCNLKNTT